MKFHKGTFLVQCIDTLDHGTEERTGWIDETNTYGFSKNQKDRWSATDMESGTLICTFDTRKACAEWIEKNADKIAERRTTDEYVAMVEKFKMKKGES